MDTQTKEKKNVLTTKMIEEIQVANANRTPTLYPFVVHPTWGVDEYRGSINDDEDNLPLPGGPEHYYNVIGDDMGIMNPDANEITAGDWSIIHVGDNCRIHAGKGCTIICGNNCLIYCGEQCIIHCEDCCFVTAGLHSNITTRFIRINRNKTTDIPSHREHSFRITTQYFGENNDELRPDIEYMTNRGAFHKS